MPECVEEYAERERCSSRINSGLFLSFLKVKTQNKWCAKSSLTETVLTDRGKSAQRVLKECSKLNFKQKHHRKLAMAIEKKGLL